jgi:hypothetical protein
MSSNVGMQPPASDMKYWLSVQKGCVRLTGLLMYLCPLPRLHHDSCCISCSVFQKFRVNYSPEFKRRLDVVARERRPLYIPIPADRPPVFFVLHRTEALLEYMYPMHVLDYCFLGPPLPGSIEQQSCPKGSLEFGTIVIRWSHVNRMCAPPWLWLHEAPPHWMYSCLIEFRLRAL